MSDNVMSNALSEAVTEAELKAKAVAPRVTPEHIESLIIGEFYNTQMANISECRSAKDYDICMQAMSCLTLCVLVLKNGFTVVGQSACASPENYNEDIGKRLARQDAFNKIWALEGYLLKTKLSEEG